jgi:hypothetical protein
LNTSEIRFKDLDVVHICKPRLKNSYISVTHDSKVVLKTSKVSNAYIEDLLHQKEAWIRKQLLKVSASVLISKEIEDEKKLKEYLTSRVDYFCKLMKLSYSELKFKKLKSRWGSCDSKGVVTLNIYLYNTSAKLIDYVVVHELAHLVHMNHSKEFHQLVLEYIPDAKENRKSLKNIVLT